MGLELVLSASIDPAEAHDGRLAQHCTMLLRRDQWVPRFPLLSVQLGHVTSHDWHGHDDGEEPIEELGKNGQG